MTSEKQAANDELSEDWTELVSEGWPKLENLEHFRAVVRAANSDRRKRVHAAVDRMLDDLEADEETRQSSIEIEIERDLAQHRAGMH